MKIEAISKARVIAWVELDGLTKGGRIRLADLVKPLVEKWEFQKFPVSLDDFDLEKNGVQFQHGMADGFLVDSVVIYNEGIVLDTLASTDESQRILIGMLEWAKEEFQITLTDESIRRWSYLSHVVFKSDIALLNRCSPPAASLAQKVSTMTEGIYDGLKYDTSQLWIGHDPQLRKTSVANFVIQHRANTSYQENIFWSEAPLPTRLHLQFLEEFERDVKALYEGK